jgi:hypothetical protein
MDEEVIGKLGVLFSLCRGLCSGEQQHRRVLTVSPCGLVGVA